MNSLIKVIETLRGENGCPWDKKQTPRSMCIYLVEEIYELLDAIESGNPDAVCEELGDVLFHILFITSLFQKMKHFDIADVADVNTEKMTRRHPHVFGDAAVDCVDEVKNRWYKIKMKEKNHNHKDSILDSIPASLPALLRAYRVSERAARIGFDWADISGVMQKTEEEWAELKTELERKDNKRVLSEFGDLLFTLVNVARFAGIHPETALVDSIKKFETRFKYMEKVFSDKEKSLESASPDELDMLWEEAKSVKG